MQTTTSRERPPGVGRYLDGLIRWLSVAAVGVALAVGDVGVAAAGLSAASWRARSSWS